MNRNNLIMLMITVLLLALAGCEEQRCVKDSPDNAKLQSREAQQKSSETKRVQETAKKNEKETAKGTVMVKMETSMGDIVLELNAEKAPLSAKNFIKYAEDGFYDGTIFHRVIDGFMIQGGGFETDMAKKQTREPIKNEGSNGLENDRGTIAMARTPYPHSATSQFFINLKDNDFLNYQNDQNPGYAVFGKVIEGMKVVDKIAGVDTTRKGQYGDVPVETVEIKSVEIID